jgi:hypothetical protein
MGSGGFAWRRLFALRRVPHRTLHRGSQVRALFEEHLHAFRLQAPQQLAGLHRDLDFGRFHQQKS